MVDIAREPGTAEAWTTDIARACDDLGLGITRLEPDSLEVLVLRERVEVRLTVGTFYLTGNLLRRIFAKPEEA